MNAIQFVKNQANETANSFVNSAKDNFNSMLRPQEEGKTTINDIVPEVLQVLEEKLRRILEAKKNDFITIIIDKINVSSSIQHYLKQMNPSYDLSNDPKFGGSGTKHVKRKRKTKKKPKHIHNKTKKRQQGGNSDFLKQIINSSLQIPNLTKVLQSAITNVMISFPESPQNHDEIEEKMKEAMKRIFDKISLEDIKKAILSEKCAKHIQ